MNPSAHLTPAFAHEFAALGPDPAKLAAWAAALDGWMLVPKEPTEAMIDAGIVALREWRKTLDPDERMLRHTIRNGRPYTEALEREKYAIRWRAMIAAQPAVPQIADFLDTVIALCETRKETT